MRVEKLVPRLATRVKENRPDKYAANFTASNLYARIAENIAPAEAAQRFNAYQYRPRARQSDAKAAERKRYRITPACAQVLLRDFKVFIV